MVDELGVVPVDFPLGKALEHFFEDDAAFQAGERLAQAVVRAESEAEVLPGVPALLRAGGGTAGGD